MKVTATDGRARAGVMSNARGDIATPVFMPVGTRAAVKTLDTGDLERLGPPIVLGNTYHLMERPGADLIERHGGLHQFMDWSGHMLTDSGGYQIFSLEPKVTEDGATFKSVYDGSSVHLTPERSVHIQQQLGADVAMVLDVCPPLPSAKQVQVDAVERTLRWAVRSKEAHTRADQSQFGMSSEGRLNLKNQRFADDGGPIDPNFEHPLSSRYSRAYIRHLLNTNESTAGRIITLHNLAWLADLTNRMRSAIEAGTFEQLRSEIWATWS